MVKLNFPNFPLRIKSSENNLLVFDVIRKKYVPLSPEEWVRQHCIHYLVREKGYPAGRTLVEKKLVVEGIEKRVDIAICHPDGRIHLLVECKAAPVEINQEVFDQIARYNWEARADLLMVTNGLEHYYCRIDYDSRQYTFLPELPEFLPSGKGLD